MKNIHVIPTDKPSRLFIGRYRKELFLCDKPTSNIFIAGQNQHIYTTSDEEIKEGDWVYNIAQKTVFKADKTFLKLIGGTLLTNQKIILTTDQDLIGVQKIDDEFLEWFVKNPSCEEVEVELFPKFSNKLYGIIIPKEELKTSEEWQKQFPNTKVIDPDGWDRKNYQYSWFEQKITLAEYTTRLSRSTVYGIILKKEQKQHLIDMMQKDEELGLYDIFNDEKRQGVKELIDAQKQRFEKYSERFDNDKSEIGNPDTWGKRVKQETLEEAAKNYANYNEQINKAIQEAVKFGAKWQAERMYSEGDMLTAMGFASSIDNNMESDDKLKLCIDFIQQFKNK